MADDLLTGIISKKYRSVQLDNLLYLTDGLHQPKMYDGEDIVNWGIERPLTACAGVGSSTGLNTVDLCETI